MTLHALQAQFTHLIPDLIRKAEELGFVGREEGMVAWAIAAIEKI